ncbi:carboxypeptidase-like regulatory domain-containing protein [Niabella sp. W65]|nr:carboxypeptidase-like regulatory domain-containing protein [Niabella sp. W65]MCH7368453.1 carboxypeptidase-like regulatory domain-containing protein [Niabella sp. W65]ULT44050.1 carboxypeptidase-like regulatory domain-containing protein [Niabella sp. I65]
MKLVGFLSVFLALSIVGQAQTVKGTLMDPVEGVVVKGATVQLLNPSDSSNVRSTTSDSSGTFLFTNLNRGSYVLKATSIGFETFLRSIALNDSTPLSTWTTYIFPKKPPRWKE